MKYAEARLKIKTGDMLLWRNHKSGGLRATIERWFVEHGTASPYTHVGYAWVEHNRVWVIEITTKGCAPRLLSQVGDFDWAVAPKQGSEKALNYGFSCFGVWTYSKWQAIKGQLKTLIIGEDLSGQCAELAISMWRVDDMAPSTHATPAACAYGAMTEWGSSITYVDNGGIK